RLAEESVVAGFCGRDVKNAVIEAAVRTAQQGGESLTLDGLLVSIQRIRDARPNSSTPLTEDDKNKACHRGQRGVRKQKERQTP
ncbi:MAG: hypothetical protein LBR38_03105, partial [Synergistaceae bacterium]|nr:hypothetical protein [Synergistaceae bacterium]